MRRLIIISLFCFVSIMWAQNYTPRQILFKVVDPQLVSSRSSGDAEFDVFIDTYQLRQVAPLSKSADNQWFVASVDTMPDWEQINSRRDAFDGILYYQPNYLNEYFAIPNDPSYHLQQMQLINLPQAWDYTTGRDDIIIAVIDSGIALEHPDLVDKIFINEAERPISEGGTGIRGFDDDGNGYIDDWHGWDFSDAPELSDIGAGDYTDQDNDPSDESWHGTHVSGILGATTNNNIGIAGVCWNAKILPLRGGFKTTSGSGYLQDDDVAAALIYAADMGADVINCSWGDAVYSQVIADACQYAYNKGAIIIAAAGNTPEEGIHYPAKLSTTISVGAVDANKLLTGFSSFGPNIDIVAPGQRIYSTYNPQHNGGYEIMDGTSMAAPYISGAVALYLSTHPGSSFEEVAACMFSTAEDIGMNGFDNHYGNGLIDVFEFVTSDCDALIQIDYPRDYESVALEISDDDDIYFDIEGTIDCPDFLRYSVMYTRSNMPGDVDWKDVTRHTNSPLWHTEAKTQDTFARFMLPFGFDDGDFLVRIEVSTSHGKIYQNTINISVDQSTPKFRPLYFKAQKRYLGENVIHYIQTLFDEPVVIEMNLRDSQDVLHQIYSNVSDSLHILRLPTAIADGALAVSFVATDRGGLSYDSSVYENFMMIESGSVPVNGYIEKIVAPGLVFIAESYDFDGNGLQEFVGMTFENSAEGDVAVYELNETNNFTVKHNFAERFWPKSIGNSNDSGVEIIGLRQNYLHNQVAVLYETLGDENHYPAHAVAEVIDVLDADFFDYDLDGVDEIIAIRSQGISRLVSLYERTDRLELTNRHDFFNISATNQLNLFVPTVKADHFHNEIHTNIITADTDGDIIIYETNQWQTNELKWMSRLPVPNAYLITKGDYNGDGQPDFCVGGYSENIAYPEKSFWYFAIFTYSHGDETYVQVGEISFDAVESNNFAISLDTDGDNDDELILSVSPHLYIVDLIDGVFQPVWKTTASDNYGITGLDASDIQGFNLFVNEKRDGNLVCKLITPAPLFNGPATPQNISTKPLSSSAVEVRWNNMPCQYYNVHRRDETSSETAIIGVSTETSFVDNTVLAGNSYEYAVTAYDSLSFPLEHESRLTLWKEATPLDPPSPISAPHMIGPRSISMYFNSPLSNDSFNIGHFYVNNGVGLPSSVQTLNSHRGFMLNFSENLEYQENYVLFIRGLKGDTGVEISNNIYSFTFNNENTPPYLVQAIVRSSRQVEIRFSEAMRLAEITKVDNYLLNRPGAENYEISSISASSDSVIVLQLTKNLESAIESYYLSVNDVHDIAGNRISIDGSNISFQLTEINNLAYLVVVPNPLTKNVHAEFRFENLPLEQSGSIYVYDISGALVFKDIISPRTESNKKYVWDAKNNLQRSLGSGTYFYVLKMGKDVKKGTLAIVN